MKIKKFNKISILLVAVIFLVISLAFSSCCIPFNLLTDDEAEQESQNSEVAIEKEPLLPEPKVDIDLPKSYLLSILEIPGQAIDVDASGDYAYLTNDMGMLYVVDVSDRRSPFITGKTSDIPAANIVLFDRGFAYVSYTNWIVEEDQQSYYSECGFKIVDARDKKDPYVLSTYESGDGSEKSIQGIFFKDDHVFLNTTVSGPEEEKNTIEIVDVGDKTDPKLLSTFSIDSMPTGIFIEGEFLYLNTARYDYKLREYSKESTLEIIDISDPKRPDKLSSITVPANSWSLLVEEGYAFLSSSIYDDEREEYQDSYIQIVDVRDPENPELLGNIEILGGAWELDMNGDFLYVSNNEGGISAVDIRDKQDPEIVDLFNTNGNSYDVTIWGEYGYIADGFEGLVIIGLQDEDEATITTEQGKNRAPYAEIDTYGDMFDEDKYILKYPIYFSGSDSIDPDGDKLTYEWEIESVNGDKPEYYLFGDPVEIEDSLAILIDVPGKYFVELEVSDGINSDIEKYSFTVEEYPHPVVPIKLHDFEVEIECQIKNEGPVSLEELECYIRTPQTYYPYQQVKDIEYNVEPDELLFDNNWNLLTHFELEDLEPGETMSTKIIAELSMYEYEFKKLQLDEFEYAKDDPDLATYTRDDLYIDSDSPAIIEAVEEVIGEEKNPITKAEMLYDFVIERLYYDYGRAEEGDYEFWNASEILDKGRGVCADYAILYTALLRAAGIPARLVGGIPVYTILFEPNKELDVAHEWVELKLPEYGWISIDITLEEGFMSNNYFFNIVTDKGPGFLYEGTTMDWGSYYYDGYKYTWEGDERPKTEQSIIFKVTGLDVWDLQKSISEDFLINVGNVLDEYNLAINHMNIQYEQTEGFFDDTDSIALEESFYYKLVELSGRIEDFSYPETLKEQRDDMVLISEDIYYYQGELIDACKAGDYMSYIVYFDHVYGKIDELFNYYNKQIT